MILNIRENKEGYVFERLSLRTQPPRMEFINADALYPEPGRLLEGKECIINIFQFLFCFSFAKRLDTDLRLWTAIIAFDSSGAMLS